MSILLENECHPRRPLGRTNDLIHFQLEMLDFSVRQLRIKLKMVDSHYHLTANIQNFLPECLGFINEALLSGRIQFSLLGVLVSCLLALCPAFLMTRYGMTAG